MGLSAGFLPSGRRAIVLAALGLGLLFFAVPAAADSVICDNGSDAGDCSGPTALAVDHENELLYVADNGNRRVDVFKLDKSFVKAFGWDVAPEGALGDTPGDGLEVCTTLCKAGSSGVGAGQFGSLGGIAVDNDPTSAAHHDIYVLDGANSRVQRFHPSGEFVLMFGKGVNQTTGGDVCTAASGDICKAATSGTGTGQFGSSPKLGLGPGGILHVADEIGSVNRRVQKFNHEGALTKECTPLSPAGEFGGSLPGIAVDSTGTFYFASGNVTGAVRKYDSNCALLDTFHSSFNIQALAVDTVDSVFIADSTNSGIGGETAIYAYDSVGVLFKVFYGDGTLQQRAVALAPDPSGTGTFAAEITSLGRVLHVAFPPPGPIVHPDPDLTIAFPIGSTKATLNSRVNPEGKASKCWFEYVDDATFEASDFAAALSSPEVDCGSDFQLQLVSAQIGCSGPGNPPPASCLIPDTLYHFRSVAENADGGPSKGPVTTFETKPSIEFGEAWASEVGIDATLVHTEVNPLGVSATAYFEYVDEATFQASGFANALKAPDVEGGEDPLELGSGEALGTMSVLLHSLEPGTTYRYRLLATNAFAALAGPERIFRTFALPGPAPECLSNQLFRVGPSATLPDCRAYEMVSPVDKEGGEIRVQESPIQHQPAEYMQSAATVPAEGIGITYSSDRAFGDIVSAPYTSQYLASRHPPGDSEEGWRNHGISPPREGAVFVPEVALDTQYKAFAEDLRFGWLRTDSEPPLTADAIPGFANLYRRDNLSDGYEAICPTAPPNTKTETYLVAPQGFSADGEVAVFRANDKLTPNASSVKGIIQLYGCANGELVLVSVLPGAAGKANSGNSAAGTALNSPADHRQASLHNAISEDGSRVYWTNSTSAASLGPGKIYLRENPFGEGGQCTGPGTPCTMEVSEGVGGPGSDGPAQFWTASRDGTRAIFSFPPGPGALAGNLYAFDAMAGSEPTELIAEGVSGLAGFSEDARRVYFISTKALTAGTVAGKANLYLHAAGEGTRLVTVLEDTLVNGCGSIGALDPTQRCPRATPDGRRLLFASQDPLTGYDNADALSGAPNAEVYLYDSSAASGEGELICVSCNPSGGRPTGAEVDASRWVAARIVPWENAFHASRVLVDDGRRLFFESFDALLPQDTNGALDVYQWEEAGKGDCGTTDPNHFPQNGGCLSLISSGKSPEDSEFVDASADGSDVFFKTAASLRPEDPGLVDIYDARVGGGFPLPPGKQPPCEGEACQSPPPPSQAVPPASSAFRGPGNPKQPCPKGKRKVRRAGKLRCAKKQRAEAKRHSKRRRGKR